MSNAAIAHPLVFATLSEKLLKCFADSFNAARILIMTFNDNAHHRTSPSPEPSKGPRASSHEPATSAQPIVAHHPSRIEQFQQERKWLQRTIAKVSRWRGVTFFCSCIALYVGFAARQAGSSAYLSPLGFLAAGAFFLGFFALVWYYEWLQERDVQLAIRVSYHQVQLARQTRDWQRIPVSGITPLPEAETVAGDLDLFGPRSLCDLLAETHTPAGRDMLRRWLFYAASPDEIRQRQQAVRWLTPQTTLREDFAVHGRILADRRAKPDELVRWGAEPGWLAQHPWIIPVATCAALTTVGLVVGVFARWIAPEWFVAALVMPVFHILFNAVYVGSVHDIYNRVSNSAHETHYYHALLLSVWQLPDEIPEFHHLRQQLTAAGTDFEHALRSLRWHIRLSSGRRSGAFSLLYFLVQIAFFWDFYVLIGLERWQRRFGPSLAHWFSAVGQFEVLCSFAGLAHNHPDWCFPDVGRHDGSDVFAANELGHPLLPPESCVRNHVSIGPAGRFLFITGSNMSGKSTLLRSLGTNIVLAQAGSVVCATDVSLMPVVLETSVRIRDSLAEGTSFFMAELKRLKQIVDRALACQGNKDVQLFFLLDEILQGTNSKERHLAVEHILAHLVDTGATGAVTTHDIELCHSPALRDHCDTAHFRESFVQRDGVETMVFDYRLRPGVCPTTNALKLLEMIGL